MSYEVINTATDSVIKDTDSGLKVKVVTSKGIDGTAFCQATQYAENGCFTATKIYTFQVISEGEADVDSVKKIAIFFFASLLDTELFVIEVPRNSALFPQESERIFGSVNYEQAS